ncbi:serine/threonine-protein kinase Nek10 [Eucyclogobius newberryi]|uniref:serine/threonine-protein kinase Nek10 n=1 Tax=Eucyclogobius newberryi TaxID=166745 RepID=UPI003B58D94F
MAQIGSLTSISRPRGSCGYSRCSPLCRTRKFEEYEKHRCFSSHALHKLFRNLLISLVKNRLCSDWIDTAGPESVLRVLICLRILVRDAELQTLFHQHQGITLLARYLERVSVAYVSCGGQAFAGQMLVTMTYMFQKMSACEELRPHIMDTGVHRTLVKLLTSSDTSVLLGALLALTSLAHPECREQIGDLHIVENLLVILQEYDLLSKRMSAELLRLLTSVRGVREQLRALRAVPVLLSLLHSHHVKLLWSLCWVLVQMCEEPDTRAEIRSWGGIQQLLRLLSCDRQYVGDRSSIESLSSANAAGRLQKQELMEELSPQEQQDNIAALQAACCTALTELCLDDSCAHHIVQENGVFIIAKFILPKTSGAKGVLQCYAFRALRFLFSVERNRHLFKRLFPTDLFELFIDIGHYVRDLAAYETLRDKVLLYTEEDLESLRDSIVAVDQNRPPLRVISGYSILDHLGTGAFGSVFKVRKQGIQTLLALKEVNLHNPAFGKDKKSRDSNVDKIISELSIIREQMAHPNIVKYYKTFLEGERLYIVMELIEGVPLAEHLSSLKEKNQSFTEDRLWNIFIQMCLALRYLHRDKRIVHRDLSPNNIMLGDQDWVTITDFGLAKQKEENSKLTSVVGTILYSCPEVVKSEPYGEKADVWALGCVLYQMVTLQPPFYSTNMLSLANKIVEAKYEPVESGQYSDRVIHMIRWLLSPSPEQRPDIVQVSSSISELVMRAMDRLHTSHNALEHKAQRDRNRAHRYFLERNQAMVHSAPTEDKSSLQMDSSTPRDGSDEEEELLAIKPNGSSGEFCVCAGSTALCVSQSRLRQIDDPVNRLLRQLHKLIFITQLPPSPHHDSKRHLVERFKKSLFNAHSDPYKLKGELFKLLQTSSEVMELGLVPDWTLVQQPDTDSTADGVTYEQLQGFIEELLVENGYYDCPR